MALAKFLYRQKQKLNYHLAKDEFHKRVAELNRQHQEVKIEGESFKVLGCELILNIHWHGFILKRFNLFKKLCLLQNGHFEVIDHHLIYNIKGLKLKVSTHEELFIIDEIFVQNCYAIKVPEESYMIIDVGMNVGFASLFFAQNPKVEKVFGFEPFAPTYLDALENFKMNLPFSRKIVAQNFGLSKCNDSYSVPYSNDLKGKNSIFIGDDASKLEKIDVKKANEIIDHLVYSNSSFNFYIKMDCEGAEFDIFDSLKYGKLPEQVKGILLEWHKNSPEHIIEYLIGNGFRVQVRGENEIGIIIAFR